MKTTFFTVCLVICLLSNNLFAQGDEPAKEKTKSGWNVGGVPVVGGDSDIGFQYGALVNFFHYGDGSIYPAYKHNIYMEWSKTTKGSGINQITYDSKYLIPGVRTSGEISYLTEKALDFYGFNGYEAYYNSAFEDDENSDYLSRMFYRNERKLFRAKAEFQGPIIKNKLNWFAGMEFFGNRIDTVDLNALNKGQDEDKKLPSIGGGLYGDYMRWGLLPENQMNGGKTTLLKIGTVYDTRDNEANPMKGLWTELQFIMAPSFLSDDDLGYSRLALTHRQYFTIVPKTVNLAYRLSYQAKLSGEMPFYMLPFVFNSAPQMTRDGVGGRKTVRGIVRNRVVGEDFVYGNVELRWKFVRTVILNQNIYLALSGFVDGARITGKYDLQEPVAQYADAANAWLNQGDEEGLHMGYGAGFHIAMNENFIVTLNYGLAADKRDGDSGFYVMMSMAF